MQSAKRSGGQSCEVSYRESTSRDLEDVAGRDGAVGTGGADDLDEVVVITGDASGRMFDT